MLKQSKDKHFYIRINIAEYITIILQMYPKVLLDKYSNEIMEYLKGALMDTNVDVRRKAKIAFIKYNSLYSLLGH